jgi:hypothetical protein
MLTAKLILERFDKDHRLLERREQPSRSFVLGFLKLLYVAHAQIMAASPYTMNDITNTARTVDSQVAPGGAGHGSKANLRIGAPPGLAGTWCSFGQSSAAYGGFQPVWQTIEGEKMGIVVGTGVGAVTPLDIALGTRILHGTQAGRFEYGGCELLSIAFADPNGQFTWRRYFTNNSGGLITVQEAGIYSIGTDWDDNYAWPFCIARDLTGAVGVNNTELLRATYVIQITV